MLNANRLRTCKRNYKQNGKAIGITSTLTWMIRPPCEGLATEMLACHGEEVLYLTRAGKLATGCRHFVAWEYKTLRQVKNGVSLLKRYGTTMTPRLAWRRRSGRPSAGSPPNGFGWPPRRHARPCKDAERGWASWVCGLAWLSWIHLRWRLRKYRFTIFVVNEAFPCSGLESIWRRCCRSETQHDVLWHVLCEVASDGERTLRIILSIFREVEYYTCTCKT